MLPPDTFCTWCENYAVNTMVNYYVDEARKSGVDISVSMAVPQKLSMNEAEFCSVLGNLLENALDACREYTGSNPFIRLRAKEENSHLALTVDNSCSSAPVEENGRFHSTKHYGIGTGTASVRSIAEHYHGVVTFRYADQCFFASVFL